MKRILVFGMTENPGGVESVIMNYYRNMDRSKIQFDFLCNSYSPIAFEDELVKMGAAMIHFPARSQNFFSYKKKLNSFFKEHAKDYAAIWVNVCSLANIDYLILAKKYGIEKRIIHSHNSQNMDNWLRGILHKHFKKKLEQYATDFWSCSEDASTWFYDAKLKNQVVIINNAIDVDAMAYNEKLRNDLRKKLQWENEYIIGNIGRLHFQKNQKFVINVFAGAEKKMPDARLILVGQGEDEKALKEQVKQLGLENKVLFAGKQYNIQAWLSAFDLFLFPSLFEGLSIAALEAQANGLPVIAAEKVIPMEVRINSNFKFLNLNLPVSDWIEQIMIMRTNGHRESYETVRKSFIDHGYEIKNEAAKLQRKLLGE